MSPTITATIGLISLLLCTLAAALPAPSNPIGHSASYRHHHRRLVIPSQNQPKNDALTVNSSSTSAASQPVTADPIAIAPDTNSSHLIVTTAAGTKLDLTQADTWLALQAEVEALDKAEASISATTNDSATTNELSFDDLTTDEACDPDLAALLDPNATSTSNVSLSGAPNATLAKNVSTGVVSASRSPSVNLVTGNATVSRGTAKADTTSDDSQKQKQDAEERRKKAAQDAEEARKKAEQDAEESRKKVEQDAEEGKKKAEQAAAAAKKSADDEAAKKASEEEAAKKKSEEEAAKKTSEEEASKKAAEDAEAARKSAADEAKKAADATVAQEKKDEEAKKAAEGKKDGKKDDKSTGSYTAPAGHSTGDATFYGTGLGACGVTNKDSDYICAVSKLLFDEFPAPGGNPNLSEVCGKKIVATYNGKSVTVTVQDRCEACKHDDLDFSPEAFNQIGLPEQGRLSGMTWTWA